MINILKNTLNDKYITTDSKYTCIVASWIMYQFTKTLFLIDTVILPHPL